MWQAAGAVRAGGAQPWCGGVGELPGGAALVLLHRQQVCCSSHSSAHNSSDPHMEYQSMSAPPPHPVHPQQTLAGKILHCLSSGIRWLWLSRASQSFSVLGLTRRTRRQEGCCARGGRAGAAPGAGRLGRAGRAGLGCRSRARVGSAWQRRGAGDTAALRLPCQHAPALIQDCGGGCRQGGAVGQTHIPAWRSRIC